MKHCNVCKAETSVTSCSCGKVSYCGVDCQKSDWKSHKPDCPPFKVAKLPGRGRGLLATRKINVGEVVIEEVPLLTIDSPNSEVAVDVFKGEFAKIDDKSKQTILTLFDPINDELKLELQSSISDIEQEIEKQRQADPENETVKELTKKLESLGADIAKDSEAESEGDITEAALRIFSGNSLQVCEVASIYSSTEGGLYHQISLLNHSCNPNSVWSWVKDDYKRKVVRAVKTIKKGEEVLANYVDTEEFNFGLREFRRAVLVDKFGFICRCSECALDGDELYLNEQQRKEVVENIKLVKELMNKFEEKSTVSALKTGQETVQLVREMGLVYEVPRLLLNCYQIASAARFQNIIGMVNPRMYSDQALSYCERFGDSFMHFYNFVTKQN
eukprot:GFUD01009067.1.p1 GENE.GFUD01009067.1~~GFUD01009067.1.p1  ORF type:complete len:387 (-),score=107.42 GFUD01009067.1:317-1477(-)